MNSNTYHRGRWFLSGMVISPIIVVAVVLGTMPLWLPALGRGLVMMPCEEKADAIVVLGGGGPERAMHGIQLYRQGVAPRLWFTGDRELPEMTGFTDGRLGRDMAVREGVPAGDIDLLNTSSTWEDGRQIGAMVEQKGLRRIVIVTNWYHSRRALAVIRRHLAGTPVQVYYSPPPTSSCCPDKWWVRDESLVMVINEWIKIGVYAVKYKMAPW